MPTGFKLTAKDKAMNSVMDSLVWVERLSPRRKARRSRKTWLRRSLIVLSAVAVLALLLTQ